MKARWRLSSALLVVGFVACTLNPQPLPPGEPGAAEDDDGIDAGFGSAADAAMTPTQPQDSGASGDGGGPNPPGDGGASGDPGDAGGSGDAG